MQAIAGGTGVGVGAGVGVDAGVGIGVAAAGRRDAASSAGRRPAQAATIVATAHVAIATIIHRTTDVRVFPPMRDQR